MPLLDDATARVVERLELSEKISDYLSDAAFFCKQNTDDFKADFQRWLGTQPIGELEGAAHVHALARQDKPMPWEIIKIPT
jgi:hypothetical protein